jgi:hypothetical protein
MKLDRFNVPDSQKQTTKAAIEKHGYSEEDFEWLHGQSNIPTESVYVIYKPTGFRRMYDGSQWEREFEEDLKDQIFTAEP